MPAYARATSELVLDSDLEQRLLESSDNPGTLAWLLRTPEPPAFGTPGDVGCVRYIGNDDNKRERDIQVSLRYGGGKAIVSAARAAFALARKNWNRGLSRVENATHLCGEEHRDPVTGKRQPCLNPGHLVRES